MNATEMAKPFGKQVSDWLRLNSTKQFLRALMTVRGIPRSADFQIVTRGGNGQQGTWLIREVAIEFACWLDPKFKITSP
jgi:hypothetical protein